MLLFESRNCQSLPVNIYLPFLLSKITDLKSLSLCLLFPGLSIELKNQKLRKPVLKTLSCNFLPSLSFSHHQPA